MSRIETDLLGSVTIEDHIYYGINTVRAIENFNVSDKTNIKFIHSYILVKQACAKANYEVGLLEEKKFDAINEACDILLSGKYDDMFVVDKLQGGAGTSLNNNINEVLANVALELLGNKKGEYTIIHPNDDVNMSQSTNDTYPTAVKITIINQLRLLADQFSSLQNTLQEKENEFDNILKLGRTQYMDAVPIKVSQEFGAYASVISRDRWRLYKCEERLRVINLGGTAVGTGINANRQYIFKATNNIQNLTGLGLSRAEMLVDATQNLDAFVEVSGLIKTAASNLIKICNDIRLLSSGPSGGIGELIIPKVQAGSSIMPGKVNPVILESTIQCCLNAIANDNIITNVNMLGVLELNSFLPLLSDKLLESMETLTKSIKLLEEKCIKDIKVDIDNCSKNLFDSKAMAVALVPIIGYELATKVSLLATTENISVKDAAIKLTELKETELDEILSINQVTSPSRRMNNE